MHCSRLMKKLGLRGIQRGAPFNVRTCSNEAQEKPQDLVNRNSNASRHDELCTTNITYVQTGIKSCYVAFVIDVCSRRIAGWSLARSSATDLSLLALEQALPERQPNCPLFLHSDRRVQYLLTRYTRRIEETGIENSVGGVGDSYDKAVVETIIGHIKTEAIGHLGPWRSSSAVEIGTLEWVDWYNERRLFSLLDYKNPMGFEQLGYLNQAAPARLESVA